MECLYIVVLQTSRMNTQTHTFAWPNHKNYNQIRQHVADDDSTRRSTDRPEHQFPLEGGLIETVKTVTSPIFSSVLLPAAN